MKKLILWRGFQCRFILLIDKCIPHCSRRLSHLLHPPPHCSSRPELLLRTAWAVWNMWPASHVATAPGTGGGGPHGGSVVKDAPGRSHSCFLLWFSTCTSLEGFLYASQRLWLKVKKNNTKTRVQSRRRITIPSYKVINLLRQHDN